MESTQERVARMMELAPKLYFKVEKTGSTFTLSRDVDVSEPVHHPGLTLEEAEQLLNKWKLRGFRGG